MLDVERGMWPCATRIFLPQMPQIDTETMRGAFIKKHGLHRCARMGLFTDSLLLLRCLPLGLSMRRRRNGSARIFSQAEGALRSEKSVEICEICGRQLSAQCAKEQAGCFYSPTDLPDKHRCHADYLSITQIAPSARQIDTDFSQAENLSMRARFNGYAPRGQKFIAQGKRSDARGIMCCVVCAL